MKQLAVVTLLIVGGLAAWLFASRLSADALGMAVGLVFGVLAGVPTALLVLAANRRRSGGDEEEEDVHARYGQPQPQHAFPYQPPVIVVTSPQAAPQQWPGPQTVDSVSYPVRPALPGPGAHAAAGGRVFKVVGEKEEWLDEW